MPRIIDKIRAVQCERMHDASTSTADEEVVSSDTNDNAVIQPGWHYSFEFFPPKTEAGLDNLLTRIDRMSRRLDPLFVSITWGANGSTLSRTLAIASHAQRFACVDVLLHLSCTGLTREQIAQVLGMAKSSGVRNILALRGDPPHPKRAWKEGDVSGGECDRAIDLVKLIRKLHGDYFGIGVAGHPEGHPSSEKSDEGKIVEMQHLKEKLAAGADFIITQFFYDVDIFLEYVNRCKSAGINCPIIPGIMPIQSYSSLLKMTQFCAISVPSSVLERLERVRHDDEAVKKIGCEIAAEMCNRILSDTSSSSSNVHGFHFYTLNLERSTTRILASLGALDIDSTSAAAAAANENDTEATTASDTNDDEDQIVARRERQESISEKARATRRVLPWKPSTMENRRKEDVRPINWSNRPKSYVMRTDDWDEFPK
jgi:methylenetetrahydrofolate reductase (NADPH)